MRARLKGGMIIITTEDADEREEFARFAAVAAGHVFLMHSATDKGGALEDLGPSEMACREPINVTYSVDERWRPISNLAETPFELNKRAYASVEGFWQGLKFDDETDRKRVGALHGQEAKLAGKSQPERETIVYDGAVVAVGRPEHWALMRLACTAKFTQNQLAREALLATGERLLTHRVRHDSRTIPGAIMADIWMSIRTRLRSSGGR